MTSHLGDLDPDDAPSVSSVALAALAELRSAYQDRGALSRGSGALAVLAGHSSPEPGRA